MCFFLKCPFSEWHAIKRRKTPHWFWRKVASQLTTCHGHRSSGAHVEEIRRRHDSPMVTSTISWTGVGTMIRSSERHSVSQPASRKLETDGRGFCPFLGWHCAVRVRGLIVGVMGDLGVHAILGVRIIWSGMRVRQQSCQSSATLIAGKCHNAEHWVLSSWRPPLVESSTSVGVRPDPGSLAAHADALLVHRGDLQARQVPE